MSAAITHILQNRSSKGGRDGPVLGWGAEGEDMVDGGEVVLNGGGVGLQGGVRDSFRGSLRIRTTDDGDQQPSPMRNRAHSPFRASMNSRGNRVRVAVRVCGYVWFGGVV